MGVCASALLVALLVVVGSLPMISVQLGGGW